jgi:hypothetical protein
LHQRVLQTALDPRSALIAAQDASFIPKNGRQTFGLGPFCNGCAGRAERGLELATLAVVDVTRRCAFTVACAQPPPTAQTATKQDKEETLVDCYTQPLREQRCRLPAVVLSHAVDGSCAKQKYIDAVVALQLHPITKRRCDADGKFFYTGPHPKRKGARRKYDGKVNGQELRRFDALGPLAEAAHVQGYTALVWHVTLKRRLRVVVLVNRRDPAKPRSMLLASTDLELDGHKRVAWYGARFQIEFVFRDSQQFTGLTACQARDAAALAFHCNAALATLNLVRAEDLLASTAQAPQVFSMASWKQRPFNERLLDVFIEKLALDPSWVKNHPCYDDLRAYGAIAA